MARQVAWPNLDPTRFVHPFDRQATEALSRLPFVESLVRDGFGGMVEQVHTLCPSDLDWRRADFILQAIYLDNLSNSIRIGPKQLPHLYERYVRQLVFAKLALLFRMNLHSS